MSLYKTIHELHARIVELESHAEDIGDKLIKELDITRHQGNRITALESHVKALGDRLVKKQDSVNIWKRRAVKLGWVFDKDEHAKDLADYENIKNMPLEASDE